MLRRTALAALVALAATQPNLSAQSLRYTSLTKMELGGALGTMMSMMPGVGDDMETVTSMQGLRARTDEKAGNTSTIVDWESGIMTMLDHGSRTYTRMDFLAMMEQMAGAAGAEEAQAEEAPDYEVRFDVDRTGRSEKVAGFDAEQVIFTMEIIPGKVSEEEGERGRMAVVTDLWLSKDFPEYAIMQAMSAEASERMREAAARSAGASMAMFSAFDPRLGGAMEQNTAELQKLEGQAVRSTTYMVTLLGDAELDRAAVLALEGEDLGGSVAGAAAAGAAGAARQAISGLAGRFGRGRREEPKQEEAAPTQTVFMRLTTRVEDVDTGALDAAIFEVPEGYTERAPEGPVRD